MVAYKQKTKSFLMPAEVAEMLVVSVHTVRNLADSGELRSIVTAGGHRRFRRRDVELYATKNGLTLNKPDQTHYRILVVDDDVSLLKIIEKSLRRQPYAFEVDTARNGFEAGYKAKERAPDLVLLDIMMPGLTGIDVANTLKKGPETENIRIVGMTGSPSDVHKKRMIIAGAESVLCKPFEVETLIESIGVDELAYYKKPAHVG